MPFRSKWTVEIATCSFPTWIFGSPDAALPDDSALFIDSNHPETHFLSLHGYRQWSQRLATGIRAAGLKAGDRVLLFSGNNIFFPVVFMGVVMAGAIFTGANPSCVARELAHQLRDSDAKLLICQEGSLDIGIEAARSVGMGKHQIFIFDDKAMDGNGISRSGCKNWNTLLAPAAVGEKFQWDEFDTEDTPRTMCLNYSSGTTGVPKGVEITHLNYVANCTQYIHMAQLDPNEPDERKRDRQLCFLPLYHSMGQTLFLAIAPKRRTPLWIMPRFDLETMLRNIQQFRITTLFLVPPVVIAITKSALTRRFDLSSVERVFCGAAPLQRDICVRFERLFSGKVNVKQGWGMTEATFSVLSWHPNEISTSSSVGEPNANCEIKLVDEHNEITARHERGELWVRAPNVMKGYWRNSKATSETLTPDGWLKTGDIGYVDEFGKFFIVDRKKELIKFHGNQVAPAEVEAQLLEHGNIVDAAVIGVTINGEEVPRAYVVSTTNITENDVMEWMKKRVSKTKYLRGGVEFIDAIPKNTSGKILRRLLRERAMLEVGDKPAKL